MATSCRLVRDGFSLQNRRFGYWAEYEITVDDRDVSSYEAISLATVASPNPFPAYFSTYNLLGEADVSCFLQIATCERKGPTNREFVARAEWSPIEDSDNTDDFTSRENPLTRPVIYWREWEEISVPVEKGYNVQALSGISRSAETLGPIQNAAGQEPSTPILETKRIPVLCAQKNYATLAAVDAVEQTYGSTLNDAAFANYAKGECLFRGIESSRPKVAGAAVTYYEGVIRIACQRGGWDYEMVNRGWKYLDGGDLKEATVEDANGDQVPVAEPINLELDGTRTPDGSIGTIIDYRHHDYADFSLMGV